MFQETVIHNFRLVLCTYSGQEFLLSFWNAESVEGLLDLVWDLVPAPLNPVGGSEVVVDVVEVDVGQVSSPLGHGSLDEVVVGSKPELSHPFRLFLHVRNLFDSLS